MKITSLMLENFRSVSSPIKIDFKPITLLFGPNSAGKSSILQAFLAFREALRSNNADPRKVYGGGEDIDLGGFTSLIHGHNTSREISIRVGFTIDADGISDDSELSEQIENSKRSGLRFESGLNINKMNYKSGFVEIKTAFDHKAKTPFIKEYSVGFDNELFGTISRDFLNARIVLTLNKTNKFLVVHSTQFSENDDQMFAEWYRHLADRLRSINNGLGDGIELESDDLNSCVIPIWGKSLKIIDNETEEAEFRSYSNTLSQIFVVTGAVLQKHIDSAIYLGPMRAMPARNYEAPPTVDINRWVNGMAAWDTLCIRNQTSKDLSDFFVQQVSNFISSPKNLDLGYSLKISEGRELKNVNVILGELNRLYEDEDSTAPLVARLRSHLQDARSFLKVQLIDEKRHIPVEADDIGVGVSQVIPVVVGAMDPKHKIFFVEQPEIHIHPRVQCALADLFVEQIYSAPDKLFVLETHSEHLILRLLRRIREATEEVQKIAEGSSAQLNLLPDENKKSTPQMEFIELTQSRRKISCDQVAVIYIESDENGMSVTNIPINEDGEFNSPWPSGFFEERMDEVF